MKKRSRRNLALLVASFVLVSFIAVGLTVNRVQAQGTNGDKIVIDGSTTVGPIAKAFAQYYMKKNPGVNITVSESGSGNGAKSLVAGTCHVADMSRFMKDKEFKAAVENGIFPVAHVIAVDGIAMIVHPSNPIKELAMEKVKEIYKGKYTNWSQLGGPNLKIVLVSRDTSSGTYECFHKLIMEKEEIVSDCEYVGSNAAARERVRKTAGAIAYVGIGFVDRTVKALTINGVDPTRETIATGKYPVARPLFMFTNGYPKLGTHLHNFMTLWLTKDGQKIIESIGFVPQTSY